MSKSKRYHQLEQRQTYIEQELQKAIGDGNVSHLVGAGEPLEMDDDSHTPQEMRAAYKIMRDNDLQPEWIMLSKEINKAVESLLEELQLVTMAYKRRMERAASPQASQKAKRRWQNQLTAIENTAEKINRKILNYNLKLPYGVQHKTPLNLDAEIKRLLES